MRRAAMIGSLIRFRTLAALTLSIGLAAPAVVYAQFSGPAIPASVDTNQPHPATTDTTILMPGQRDPVIYAGDLLTVRVFGTMDFAPPVRVSVDGNVQLPLIGLVPIAGLTVNSAADLIAQRLTSAGMFVNPQVSIQVTEASVQFATVAGEMHGLIPISGSRHLLDVLAAAGSMPATASHVITVLRAGAEKPIIVDLGTDPTKSAASDITILPGDKIIVSKVGVVYILGAFKTQGAIPLQQNSPLTLMQATAISGGAGFEGKYRDLRIVRTQGLSRTVVKIDIAKVLNGTAPDPVLQADDIVFLPPDSLKAAIKSGGINTVTSVVSVLLIGFASGLF
jgi:polysaccharide biosynthesis/export protein